MAGNVNKTTEVWWTNPLWLVLGFVLPVYLLVFCAPLLLGQDSLLLRGATFFTMDYFLLGLAYISVFAVGVSNGLLLRRRNTQASVPAEGTPVPFLDVVGMIAIGAYIIWFHELLLRPWYLLQIFTGEANIFVTRSEHGNIPGITSFTQLGIVFFVFYFDAWWRSDQALSRRHHLMAAALMALTVFRVFVWGERLALIEVVIPVAVIAVASGILHRRKFMGGVVTWAPFLGVGALLGYFAVTEAFRSWTFYQDRYEFWPFVISRVTTYYYTALNNGAGLLATMSWPANDYQNVLGWLYKTPLLGGIAAHILELAPPHSPAFLAQYADPEFNNMSGIFTVFFDLGIVGALLFAWIYGCVIGVLYVQFVEQRGIGRFLYPAIFVSILELMRVLYVTESRFFLVVVGTLTGVWLLSQRRPDWKRMKTNRNAVTGDGL